MGVKHRAKPSKNYFRRPRIPRAGDVLPLGALGGFALLLGFVAEGLLLSAQVQGLEPRMKVLESRLERNSLLFDRLDTKVDEIRNEVTRITAMYDKR